MLFRSEVEQVNEETHTCPLCESKLEKDISDEKLTEHIEMMLGIINEMNDITDEELEAIEEEVGEDEDADDDSEVVEEAKGKMPAFLAKMKEDDGEGEGGKPATKGKKSVMKGKKPYGG